jgi:hypothetical protein
MDMQTSMIVDVLAREMGGVGPIQCAQENELCRPWIAVSGSPADDLGRDLRPIALP